jgi:hypothetical protein
VTRVLGAVAAVLLLAGACTFDDPPPAASGPVAVPAPSASLSAQAAAGCSALVAALPDEIDPGVRRRPVEGDAERTAAWGDPAVVLQCGVEPPDRPEEPAQVNGVLWSVRDVGAGFRWTTEDLAVPVAVEIPDAYDNGAELVNPLAEPLLDTLPRATPSPAR